MFEYHQRFQLVKREYECIADIYLIKFPALTNHDRLKCSLKRISYGAKIDNQ